MENEQATIPHAFVMSHSSLPLVVGILGGVASGKSTVARLFCELGAAVVDADRIGHELLESPDVKRQLVNRWGREILDSGGRVDRARVAEVVFADAARLGELNALLHPRIRKRMFAEVERARHAGEHPLIVLDAALLVEGGLAGWCDALVFVDVGRRIRQARARGQRGWRPGELERRERTQESLARKKKQSDYVIRNSGSLEHTSAAVRELYNCLVARRE